LEKQNEEKVDSAQPVSNTILADYPDIPEDFKVHYTQVIMNNLGIRIETEKDFRWIRQRLILMREVSHSERINIINEMIEYFDRAIPELEKIRTSFQEQIDSAIKSVSEPISSD